VFRFWNEYEFKSRIFKRKTFAPLLPCSGSEPEVLKAGLKLQAGEVIDASTMSR
jgi:hypothetical protein